MCAHLSYKSMQEIKTVFPFLTQPRYHAPDIPPQTKPTLYRLRILVWSNQTKEEGAWQAQRQQQIFALLSGRDYHTAIVGNVGPLPDASKPPAKHCSFYLSRCILPFNLGIKIPPLLFTNTVFPFSLPQAPSPE